MTVLSSDAPNPKNSPEGCVKNSAESILTPIKAIRAYCLGCCCGSYQEVQLCPVTDCELYPYRLGHNPNIKRQYTEEQKRAMVERMKKARKD